MEKLQKLFESVQNPNILDIATGSGQFIHLITSLTSNYQKIIGIDASINAIKVAKSHFENQPNIEFLLMDANKLDFEEKTFDIVTLSNSLHHFQNVPCILIEIERVLKPGGCLIVCEMVSEPLTNAQISHRLIHHFAAKIDRSLGMIHDETYPKDIILDLLQTNPRLSIDESWDLTTEPESLATQDQINGLLQTLDRLVDRLKDESLKPSYKAEAESIKEYVLKYGFESATEFIVVLKK